MSGITGIYNLYGDPVDPHLLTRMTESMAQRGLDGSGQWLEGAIGLGHRMLHCTPESLYERQPAIDEMARAVIVADSRIDNRNELIASLGINEKHEDQITDPDLIMRAYQKWGEASPEKLSGDFAFVIWDKVNRLLFCARDAFGIKPFYYYFDGAIFLWASEPRALFYHPLVSKRPNRRLMGRYLLDDFSEHEETLYKGITRLSPAHSLTIQGKEAKKKQYWDIDPSRAIRYKREGEYTEHFFDLFQGSVKSCLRSNGPVGAWLSGGLDSSSIVCLAQKLYEDGEIKNNGFETFSIVFDELPCDEKTYIQAVAERWGLTSNLYVYEQNSNSVNIDMVRRYADVLYDPTLFMVESALTDAKQKGIKVMLSGIGGDDILAAGFHHLADLLRGLRIRRLLSQIRADAKGYERRSVDMFLYSAVLPNVPRPVKKILRRLLKPFRKDTVPPWVSKEFLKEPGMKQYIDRRPARRGFSTHSQEQIYNGLRFEWNPTISLPAMDLFVSQFNMETRYPFFDRRLIEYLIAIPEEQRWVGDQPKRILRDAMRGILPEVVRARTTKADFDPVLDLELKVRQKGEVMRLFGPLILTTLGIVDDKLVRNIFEQYCLGDSKYRAVLSVILRLELWCRAEFERPQSGYAS